MAPPIRCGSSSGGSSIATRSVTEWKQFFRSILLFFLRFFFGQKVTQLSEWFNGAKRELKTWSSNNNCGNNQKRLYAWWAKLWGGRKSVGLLKRYKNFCYSLVIFYFSQRINHNDYDKWFRRFLFIHYFLSKFHCLQWYLYLPEFFGYVFFALLSRIMGDQWAELVIAGL